VVTLDINMPRTCGMTALSQSMVEHPCPVVMVSSLTQKDALPTLEALALGAVDFVAKPSGSVSLDVRKIEVELLAKVRSAALSKVGSSSPSATRCCGAH
jgi:two-component system chemotaxis response regulator CheB